MKKTNNFKEYENKLDESILSNPSFIRLKDQINWYDKKSIANHRCYMYFKIIQIVLAVLIPFSIILPIEIYKYIVSLSGVAIAILEGLQHLFQYSTLWISYRSTAERLKHEYFLFIVNAGPYKDLSKEFKFICLAERTEEQVSTEHANWFNEIKKSVEEKKKESK
jgi:hypothetical protein